MQDDPTRERGAMAPVAYLTGEYPKVSHTFILREIAALRAAGVTVDSCTIRRAPAAAVVGEDQQAEARRTFCVVEAAKSPLRLLGAHLEALRSSPKRWASTLGLAWKTRPPGLKAGIWQLFYFLEAGVLAQHLRRQGVGHIHNHFGDSSGSVTMLTAEMAGLPYSITMHGPSLFYQPYWWRIDAKIARAAFIACISHFCRSQAMYFSDRAHWGRLKIVHCGVEAARYGTRRRDPGERIVFVGRLDAVKGVPLLIEAMTRLHPRRPGARLTLVGDGPARAALEAQVAEAGLGAVVDFLGYRTQDEVAALLEDQDMLVLPSFAEGVPVVLMEAMASRLPVIASQVAGVGELIEEGVSGFMIPPGDLDTLVARIEKLLADPDLRVRMGAAGRARVEAEFDIGAEARWLAEIFRGSMAGTLPEDVRPAGWKSGGSSCARSLEYD